MLRLSDLIEGIAGRTKVCLRQSGLDVGPYLTGRGPGENLFTSQAIYGLSTQHPFHLNLSDSCLSGSYLLGCCQVDSSLVIKSDVRGDELKRAGQEFTSAGLKIPIRADEKIQIKNSLLTNALVHSHSHDPKEPENFLIKNAVVMPFANLHGSPAKGGFFGTLSTVDLTSVYDSVVGEFAYVQVGEMSGLTVGPGRIWINAPGAFEFKYFYEPAVLQHYVRHVPGQPPQGMILKFIRQQERKLEDLFSGLKNADRPQVPESSSVSPYSVIEGSCEFGRNVFVSQRACLKNAVLGDGANVQENCFVFDSTLHGQNITAHGGKVIQTELGENVFVGFNSFLRGTEKGRLKVGRGCIIMPHTIIDVTEPLEAPEGHLVWGCIRRAEDLAAHSLSLERLSGTSGELSLGNMTFTGEGAEFVKKFSQRLEHILRDNGAFFNGREGQGHAQKCRSLTYHLLQPFPEGDFAGLFPNISIRP